MPVCIAGMHRSGTSFVARMLRQSGLYLGEERDLLPPAQDNEMGFFEHTGFLDLNDAILYQLGGAWDCPPSIAHPWQPLPEQEALKAEAMELLERFDGKETWGWKDPRASLTMPFWSNLVPGMKVVICLRNPLEVAFSLNRRQFFSHPLGLALWTTYNESVLRCTPRAHRIIVHYDACFQDCAAELRRVWRFLAVDPSSEVISRVVPPDRSLRHSTFTSEHLAEFGVHTQVRDLYAAMCEEAEWLEPAGPEGSAKACIPPGKIATVTGIGRVSKPAIDLEIERRKSKWLQGQLAMKTGQLRKAVEERDAARREGEVIPSLSALEAEIAEMRRDFLSIRKFMSQDRIRRVVAKTIPSTATVLVVSGGDDQLLELNGQTGWHFPRNKAGHHMGHDPADSAEAILQIEALRQQGAAYVLVPADFLWWLDQYAELRKFLENTHTMIAKVNGLCAIFALEGSIGSETHAKRV